MKIKLNFLHTHAGKVHQPGSIVDLPDAKARFVLDQRHPAKAADGRDLLVPSAELVSPEPQTPKGAK